MPLTPKEMIKLLEKNGFKKNSQNGSHVKMKQAILKEAGLKVQVDKNGGNVSE